MVEIIDTDDQPQWADTLHDPQPEEQDYSPDEVPESVREKPEPVVSIPPQLPALPPLPKLEPEPTPLVKAKLDAWQEGDEKVKAIQAIAAKADPEKRRDRFFKAEKELADYVASLQPGDRRKKAVREKLKSLNTEHDDAKEWAFKLTEKTRQEIAKILKADIPAKMHLMQVNITADSRISKEITAGKDWLFPLINDPGGKLLPIEINADATVSRTRAMGGHSGIHMTLVNDARTVVHEIGHCLEDQIPGTVDLEKAFLEHRTKGETPKKFQDLFPDHSYDPDERGVQDEFGKYFSPEASKGRQGKSSAYYVGKYYAGRSELLSMGLEALYDDGITFALKDPEYCKFVLGILAGAFR